MRRRLLLQQGRLPSEYQEVEYIGSSGTQYIDTLVYGTNNSIIDIKAKSTNIQNDRYLGSRDGPNLNVAVLLTIYNSNYSFAFQRYYNQGTIYDSIVADNDIHTFILDKGKLYKDGTLLWEKVDGSLTTFTTLNTIVLFAMYQTFNNTFYYGTPNIYYCKMYQNDVLQRNFIPCYRKSDGVIGMYDLCESICPLTNTPFYINAGTGTFTKGADVN